jgi:shikimate kinase
MKSSITLIGMPGAGKTVIGKLLAAHLDLTFVDTDHLIEARYKTSLQNILDEKGYLALRNIEEQEILSIKPNHEVIATGGSAVYSEKAMAFLKEVSTLVFLDIDLETVRKRIHNFDKRGIARAPGQSIEMIFLERHALYMKFCDIQVSSAGNSPQKIVNTIMELIHPELK